jgi:hypothetical protein
MPSTYSPKLKFELIAPGEQPGLWGDTTNKNVGELIEQAIAGVTTLDLTSISGNYTLTSLDGTLDQARSAVISCQGTATGAVSIIIPTSTKLYVFRNACGQTITIKTAGQVGGVTLNNGEANSVFCDGTNALSGLVTASAGRVPVSGGGTGAETFTTGFVISPSPGGTTALTTQAKINLLTDVANTLPVANGGTGQATLNPGSLLIGSGTGSIATLAGGVNGYVPTWSSSSNTWVSAAPTSGGISSISAGTGIAVNGGSGPVTSGPVTITNTNTTNTVNPTFSTSVTSPIYYIGNTNNYFNQSSDQIGVITGGSPVTKFTNQGIGTLGTLLADTGTFDFQNIRSVSTAAGFQSGLSPTSLQLGVSGAGLIYSSSQVRVEIVLAGVRAYFNTSGSFQANNSPNWATVSDVNIKTNLRPISSVLDKINALKPCHFEYKDKLGKVQTGFVAQEFATVFPGHTVDTPADDTYKEFLPEGEANLKAIDMNLTAYLVKAIQELSAKVDAQAEEIAALKAK